MCSKKLCQREERMDEDFDDGDAEDSQPVSQVSINSLNYDCLALIFLYLPVPQIREMKKVCYRWKEASQFTWPEIKSFDCNRYTRIFISQRSVFTKTMYHVGRYLTTLTLSDVFSSNILPIVFKFCGNLTKLTVDCSDYDPDDFQDIDNLNKLKYIQIHGLNAWKCDSHNEFIGIHVAEYLENLTDEITEIILTTKVPECHIPTDHEIIFDLNLEKFAALRRVKLQNCRIMTNYVNELFIKETLVRLELDHCSLEEDYYHWHPAVSNLRNLEYLQISSMSGIANEILIEVLNACRSTIKHLDLSQTWFDLNTYKEVANLENLTYLSLQNISHVDDSVISSISYHCTKLTHLYIDYRGCLFYSHHRDALTEAGLKDIAHLENLEVLSVRNVRNINDEVIHGLTKNCKKIRELFLDNCFDISTEALRELYNFDKLESLSLANLDEVDDVAILKITKNCKKMKNLVLDRCTDITGAGLVELGNLKNLESLSLALDSNIGNNAIFKITQNCKQLKTFLMTVPTHVSTLALCELRKLKNLEVLSIGRESINEILIYDIAKNCKKLKELSLSNLDDDQYLSSSVILLLIKSCPDLEYLFIPKVEISVETLKHAIKEMKCRKNNTVLKIVVNDSVGKEFEKLGKTSSLLKLVTIQCDH